MKIATCVFSADKKLHGSFAELQALHAIRPQARCVQRAVIPVRHRILIWAQIAGPYLPFFLKLYRRVYIRLALATPQGERKFDLRDFFFATLQFCERGRNNAKRQLHFSENISTTRRGNDGRTEMSREAIAIIDSHVDRVH